MPDSAPFPCRESALCHLYMFKEVLCNEGPCPAPYRFLSGECGLTGGAWPGRHGPSPRGLLSNKPKVHLKASLPLPSAGNTSLTCTILSFQSNSSPHMDTAIKPLCRGSSACSLNTHNFQSGRGSGTYIYILLIVSWRFFGICGNATRDAGLRWQHKILLTQKSANVCRSNVRHYRPCAVSLIQYLTKHEPTYLLFSISFQLCNI